MNSRYGRPLEFGISITPLSAEIELARSIAARAEALGLEWIGIQDHPYQPRFLETWALIADLLARTKQIRIFPNVANLPLRNPAMMAKRAASLDLLSGGRFELGLGAGAFWDAIAAMGGPVRSGGEALQALEEAIQIIRASWSGERAITVKGKHYTVRGMHPGPVPVHSMEIWLGVIGPRAVSMTGRLADGWVPSSSYVPPQAVPELGKRIDEAATAAGRDPAAIRRVYNLNGLIVDGATRGLLQGPPEHWVETLKYFAVELGFDTFIFWPNDDPLNQLERFAKEIIPSLQEG